MRPRMMIVDDEASVLTTCSDLFQEVGYAVSAIGTGTEAVELDEREGPFDVVLLDLHMPRLDGPEVCRRIRRTHPNSKIVGMTAYMGDTMVEQMLSNGAVAVLEKPFTVGDVIACLE